MIQQLFGEELEAYLNKWYAHRILHVGIDPRPALTKRLTEDTAFRETATKRLADLEQLDDKRCFISKVKKELLRGML